jgi:hypothetical protein
MCWPAWITDRAPRPSAGIESTTAAVPRCWTREPPTIAGSGAAVAADGDGARADRRLHLTDPAGFRAFNDGVRRWLRRHGAHPDVLGFALVRAFTTWWFGYRRRLR